MAATILIKFCAFIVYSNLNNMALSAIRGKYFKLKENIFLIFYPSPGLASKPTDYSMLRNQQERPPIKYCYPSSEIHC